MGGRIAIKCVCDSVLCPTTGLNKEGTQVPFFIGVEMNLIYQYWDGDLTPEVSAGVDAMAAYARRIDVEYRFEQNTHFLAKHYNYSTEGFDQYFGALKPLLDPQFDDYSVIMFADVDIFPVTSDNIFDTFTGEVGMVPEPFLNAMQPITRERFEHWKSHHQYVRENLNTGVCLYSQPLRRKARDWFNLPEYINHMVNIKANEFFFNDQPFLQQLFYGNDADIQLLDQDWNSHVFDEYWKQYGAWRSKRHDLRTSTTKFIHCRLEGDKLREFINEL